MQGNTAPPKLKDKLTYPKLIEGLTNIKKIVCGSEHCYAIKSNSLVYAWGNNYNGRLGISKKKLEDNISTEYSDAIVASPTIIDFLIDRKIDNIATGQDHSFAWSFETAEVYGWGSGLNGKLGFGDSADVKEPKLLECFKEASQYGMRICEIACGDNHTLAVLEESSNEVAIKTLQRKIFVWGCTKNWQLGLDLDPPEDIQEPHMMEPEICDKKVMQLSACNNYSAALTVEGQVYTWGSGEFGRLGYDTEIKHQKIPRLINSLKNIIIMRIALGVYHAAAISSSGVLFTWGRGTNGQLGHGEVVNEDTPKSLKHFIDQSKKIVDVACGENHTIIATSQGELHTWGAGQNGQLGLEDVLRRSQPTQVKISDKVFVQVSAGRKHTAALTDDGKVYIWGSNEFGQLCIKTTMASHTKQQSQIFQEKNLNMIKLNAKPFISQNNSPKEGSNQYIQKSIDAELKNFPFNNNNLTFAESPLGARPNLDNPGVFKEAFNSPKKRAISSSNSFTELNTNELIEENQMLKKRVKELELKNDIVVMKNAQQKLHEFTNTYIRLLDQDYSSNVGNNVTMIIKINSKIDVLLAHFKQKIHEMNIDDAQTILFCMNVFERMCELKKKSNYATI